MTNQPEGRALTMAEINATLRADRCSPACSEQHMYTPPCQATAPTSEACCVCGGGPVTYRNYREQPFCWPCADGKPRACTHCGGDGYDPEDPGDYDPAVHQHNPSTRQPCPECIQKGLPPGPGLDQGGRYAAQVECAIGLNVDCGGVAGVHAVRDAVMAVRDAELDASQRRAVRIQQLLDDTRDRMRKLAAELATGCPWTSSAPAIGDQIIAALHQPKEAPDA